MIVDPVSARWTDALFNVATRKGALDDVRGDVERLERAVSTEAARAFLLGGRASAARKRERLAPLLDSFHPLTRNFVELLLDRRREGVLLAVGRAFRRRDMQERGEVAGVVESARPLGRGDVEELVRVLGARLGKRVRLEPRVAPELVGGVRVYVGAKMLDHSVQGRLEGLRRRLLEAPLPTPAAVEGD